MGLSLRSKLQSLPLFSSYFSSFAMETSVFSQSVSQPPCLFPRWSSSPRKAVVLHVLPVFSFNYKFLIREPRRTPAEQSPHGAPFRDIDPSPRTTENLHSRKHQSCEAVKSSGLSVSVTSSTSSGPFPCEGELVSKATLRT